MDLLGDLHWGLKTLISEGCNVKSVMVLAANIKAREIYVAQQMLLHAEYAIMLKETLILITYLPWTRSDALNKVLGTSIK